MLQGLPSLVETAVMERATLLVNHVVAAEPAAVERLRRHLGARLQVDADGWPTWLPTLPPLVFRITPAGLVEWLGEGEHEEPELRIGVRLGNPALSLMHLLSGTRPEVTVAGNATLAADVNWLIDNLRWDLEDDLAQLLGPAPAHQLGRVGRAIADGLRRLARSVGGDAARADELATPLGAPPGPLRR